MERSRRSSAVAKRGAALKAAGRMGDLTAALTVESRQILGAHALVGLGLVDHGRVQAHLQLAVRLGAELPLADRRQIGAEVLAALGFAVEGDEGPQLEQQVGAVA